MKVKTGDRVLIRMINTGVGNHPMHLHGHHFSLVAKDGTPMPVPIEMNTSDIAPGETKDLKFMANNPGSWLFHCHILSHAEGPDGMFGLTSRVEYEGYLPKVWGSPAKPIRYPISQTPPQSTRMATPTSRAGFHLRFIGDSLLLITGSNMQLSTSKDENAGDQEWPPASLAFRN